MPGNRMRNPRPFGRNMNSNQGSGGQGFGSSGAKPMMASSGPLMTNHLELHELDLELALLKRKREMIETQHTMLVSDTRFGGSNQYGFNQAPQSYGQRSEPTRNFSNFYNDEPRQQFDRFTTQQGVKRPAIDPWDNSSPPKRFNAPSGPRRTQTRYEPPRAARAQPASQPRPLMGTSFRQRRPAPVATRTNFKPTKVTKPQQNVAPNKLNSLPVAERKNLVAKASGLVQKTPETFIYEANMPLNTKLLGRLELALGSILREMRDEYGAVEPHVMTFANMSGQRAIKQAIRERIRTIMLGKPVGAGAEIVALYRKEHPKDTDVELLDKARESIVQKGNLAIDIIKQGNPEKYFRNNFKRLLDESLNKMFEKMQRLYTNVETSGKSLQDIIDGMLAEVEKSVKETKDESMEGTENITENGESQSADNTATDADLQAKENSGETGENAALEDSAAETEENVTKPEENVAKPEENVAKPEENVAKPEENVTKPAENVAKPEDVTAKPEDAAATEQSEATENADTKEAVAESGAAKPVSKTSNEEYIRARFYFRLMDTLMKRNLPLVLPRYKEFILRILGTETAFKETKAYLVKSTNEKVDEIVNKHTATPTIGGSSEKKSLFVKIMGRPALPKKKLMKAFLDTFHPTLIKKHRNLHNVLFVAFDSQENFDNILAENGKTISQCKLDIKVSERIYKNKQNASGNANKEETQEGEANTTDGDVEIDEAKIDESIKLDDTLDDQINDLLTSIREEEEKNDDELENENTEAPANDEETQVSQNGEQASAAEKIDEEKSGNEETNKDDQDDEPEVVQKEVEAVKNEAPAKGTPTRSSARLTSTPGAVRTRRSSKLGQNN